MQRSLLCGGGLALAAVLALSAASPATAVPLPKPLTPHAVLIGGNLQENAEILRSIVELADPDGAGPQRARIAVVSAAASTARTPGDAADPSKNNAAANGLYYAELFQRYGADTYAVPIDTRVDYAGDAYVPANSFSTTVAAEISASTGIFFGGGDQMRYVRTLFRCADAALEAFTDCADTPVMAAIRGVAEHGVVAGVSAGLTIQQGADMVTGGESYQAWRDGATPGYLDDPAELGYLPYGGFGFVEGVLLDSHFTTWGRQARVIELARSTGHRYVLGVDETTAVVLDRQRGQGRVIGEQGVSIVDVSQAVETADGVSGVRWSYASAGDRITLSSGAAVHKAKDAATLRASGPAPALREDVWDSIDGAGGTYSLRDLAREVVASTARIGSGATFEAGPQFVTTLVRDDATSAWTTPAGTVSFSNLRLDITTAH